MTRDLVISQTNIERRIVTGCYDHLGGVLGERLFTFLIARKWIRKAGVKDDYAITDKGWRELAAFGIDVEALRNTKRKPVTSCTERHGRAQFEHTGAHLSSLLKRRLLELGWLRARSRTDIAVTDAGHRGLAKLGIKLG